jgi:hypothetical protein
MSDPRFAPTSPHTFDGPADVVESLVEWATLNGLDTTSWSSQLTDGWRHVVVVCSDDQWTALLIESGGIPSAPPRRPV